MPKQINTYTFGRALVAKFGLKGRFQPVLDETIVPVTVVESPIAERLCAGGRVGAASGGGNQNHIFFSNPANSQVDITIQRWWAVSGAPLTDFVVLRPAQTAVGGTGFQVFRDTGRAGVPNGVFQLTAAAAAVLGGPQYHLDTDSIVWFEKWVIRPGNHVEWVQDAQNTTLDIWVDWIETDVSQSLGA